MAATPITQYADDSNLAARQRLWAAQQPRFDLMGWVLDLAGVGSGTWVLDVGCGNGPYLAAMRDRGAEAVGGDLSIGMLRACAPHPRLVNLDTTRLPFDDGAFEVVLAPHMLYHVPDRVAAAHEIRRVLAPGGVFVATTNGAGYMASLRALIEAAVRPSTPGWELRNPSTEDFSLENGAEPLGTAFDLVELHRPVDLAPITIRDPSLAADYVGSIADHYEHEVAVPWSEVVESVRRGAQQEIDATGAFLVRSDPGAFVCR